MCLTKKIKKPHCIGCRCDKLCQMYQKTTMIEVDTSDTLLVQEGVPWPHPKEPCSREMIHLLERAEAFVSWFQPKNGDVDDQFPTIRVGARYCKLSLRLQKALFRHVRLQRDFVNRERTPDGVLKLRIPTALFMDKKKTASRFMVICTTSTLNYFYALMYWYVFACDHFAYSWVVGVI